MATATDQAAERRFLWIGFAGFMVMLSGAVTIVQGLALDHKDSVVTRSAATQLSYANLETWGWIMLTWGVIGILRRYRGVRPERVGPVGRHRGGDDLVAADVLLVFAFPIAAFTIMFIDILVIYALFAHGASDVPIA